LRLHRAGTAAGFNGVDEGSELSAGQLEFHLRGREGGREGGREEK